jgi:hypothetical protein
MISLGLTATQEALLQLTLAGNHSVNIRVVLTDNNGNELSEVSNRILAGQVDIDATQPVSRRLLLTLFDPARSLSFDSDSPEDGALWHDRMLKVLYEVNGPLLDDWVSIPVFHGGISKMSRDDVSVSVEAEGKEAFGLDTVAWKPWTFKKGSVRTLVIKATGQLFMGETKFTLPETSGRTPKNYSLGKETHPWEFMKSLSRAEGCNLFYDGRGVCVLRPRTNRPAFTFTEGDGGMVLSKPKVSFSSDNLKNVVWVKGAIPAGGKTPVEWTEVAPINHPMSPTRLGRNGVPRYMLEAITEDSIRTVGEARVTAATTLIDRLMQQVDVRFEAMPNPLLEEYDVVRIETDEFSANFLLATFTIPLVVGDSMTIGYTKNRTINKGLIRR